MLFAGNAAGFEAAVREWPVEVREYSTRAMSADRG